MQRSGSGGNIITRRLCRNRRRDDNELYRSNSFKFERFERKEYLEELADTLQKQVSEVYKKKNKQQIFLIYYICNCQIEWNDEIMVCLLNHIYLLSYHQFIVIFLALLFINNRFGWRLLMLPLITIEQQYVIKEIV